MTDPGQPGDPALAAAADRFADLACLTYGGEEGVDRRAEGEKLLARLPDLAGASIHAAAAAGDVARARGLLDADPARATAPGGPRGWVPLLYLCYSRVAPTASDPLAVARLLLARGADPNSQTVITECRFSALTGAMGEGERGPIAQPPHPQGRPLAELLLDAGADPNDSQGLYNTHFRENNAWIELLLARGLTAAMPQNWDARGGIPILSFMLGQAAVQGFTARVALLLKHGVPPDGRNHYNRRSHLENALLEGHAEMAELLLRHGAPPPVFTPPELFRVACLRGDEGEARRLLADHPEARERSGVLHAAARHGHLAAVRLALALGVPVEAPDRGGLTALHLAVHGSHLPVVEALVAAGASLRVRDPHYHGTPVGHAAHSARTWPTPGRSEVLRHLLEHSTDAFDLANHGRRERLVHLAASDAAAARDWATIQLLERLYAAFNGRDLEAAITCLHPDVDWPNAADGGRLRGREEVRAYWTQQWQALDPQVTPEHIFPDRAGHIVVRTHQVVRDLGGRVSLDRRVDHIHEIEGSLVRRMRIADA